MAILLIMSLPSSYADDPVSELRLVPFPKQVELEPGRFRLERQLVLQTSPASAELLHKLLEEGSLEELYRETELPLVSVLADMQVLGVKIDLAFLRSLGEQFAGEIDLLTETVYELAGGPFNINSPVQLGEVLFDKMKLPARKKTSKTRKCAYKH